MVVVVVEWSGVMLMLVEFAQTLSLMTTTANQR